MHVSTRFAFLPVFLAFALVASDCPAQQLPDSPAPAARQENPLGPREPESGAPLTLKERLKLQTQLSFSVISFLDPAFEAGITMADPPSAYPREWSRGGAAFGRNYGSEFGSQTTNGYTHFAAAALLREDPRYFRYDGAGLSRRVAHAILFTVADRADSGHRTFAASNFAGSAAGGFVGMAWEPDGFNDVTHAYQRSAVALGGYGVRNVLTEFTPELTRLLVKWHMGRFQSLMPNPPVDKPLP